VGLSNTVALDFGRSLFGPIGGTIFALLVAISCFGALNGADNTFSQSSLKSMFYFRLVLHDLAAHIRRRP
jgi:hypothetical protein